MIARHKRAAAIGPSGSSGNRTTAARVLSGGHTSSKSGRLVVMSTNGLRANAMSRCSHNASTAGSAQCKSVIDSITGPLRSLASSTAVTA